MTEYAWLRQSEEVKTKCAEMPGVELTSDGDGERDHNWTRGGMRVCSLVCSGICGGDFGILNTRKMSNINSLKHNIDDVFTSGLAFEVIIKTFEVINRLLLHETDLELGITYGRW